MAHIELVFRRDVDLPVHQAQSEIQTVACAGSPRGGHPTVWEGAGQELC